jgi:hypothetical protein
MAYNKFTFSELEQQFGLKYQYADLNLDGQILIYPSERVRLDLEEGLSMPHFTEKAKSEWLITPILRELARQNDFRFSVFAGYALNVDKKAKLVGFCDYLLTKEKEAIELQSPIFCLVEAKDRAVEEGLAQCAAEMYAAKLFNANNGHPIPKIYGAVTNAFDWLFLKLEDNVISIDTKRYFLDLDRLEILLSAFQQVIKD